MRRIIGAIWVVFIMGFGLQAAEGAQKIQVMDMAKRRVEVPTDPKRIIAIGPGALRMVCYLDAVNRVAGVETFEKSQPIGRPYMLAYPELVKLPPIGQGGASGINKEPDLEAVLRVSPEVIFVASMEPSKADGLQKKLGIPVIMLSYGSAGRGTFDETAYESLRLAGNILKKEKRAEEVIGFIEQSRQELRKRTERVKEDLKPRVYVGGISLRGMQGIESTDADYLPLEWVRARNLAREGTPKGHLFVDKEKLLSWNPDLVFVDAWGLSLITQDYQRKPDFYKGLKAVRERKTHILYPFNMYTTNIETVVADAYAAGKILYPDLFQDLEIPAKADAIYSFFLKRSIYSEIKRNFGDLGRVVDLATLAQSP